MAGVLGYGKAGRANLGPLRGIRGGSFIVLRFMPMLPRLFGEILYVIAVEHLPEGRTEYPFAVQDGETKGIGIYKLVGIFVNAHFAADTLRYDEEGKNGPADYIEVLGKAAESYVHILKGLGEHVNRHTIMAVVFEEVDSGFGEGFIVPVVELHASFIYNHFAILYHIHANIGFSVQLIGALNGNVRPDGIRTLPIVAVQYPVGEAAREAAAKTYDDGFTLSLTGQIGRISSLSGAGNAKVYVELERVFRMTDTVQEAPENGYQENITHIINVNQG